MIDLHIHTKYSDGTDSVIEVLRKAEKLGLKAIAITDHENCDAYKEIAKIDVGKYFPGRVLHGIELKARYTDRVIDVLGYNIDCEKMEKYLKDCYGNVTRDEIQERQLRKFYEYKDEYGLVLDDIDSLKWDKHTGWASIVFYDELKKHEENKAKVPADMWDSFTVFKRNYYHGKGKPFYVDNSVDYPSLEKIIEIIHKSGGLAFVAHIYEYAWIDDKIAELEKITDGYDIDGIECYHSIFSLEHIELVKKFCKSRGLLMSGGSDYHGLHKPDIEIGSGKGQLCIPDEIYERIIEK